MTTTRRAALTALAGASALAIPAVAGAAAEPDPALAAIEAHRIADNRLTAACGRADEVAASEEGREVTEADEAELSDATDAETMALDALMASTPTTKPGAQAFIAYLAEQDCIRLDVGDVLAMLARSPLLALSDGRMS
jgi:hypothetical protein